MGGNWSTTVSRDKAFFCNSGAEALEASIKISRKHHDENGDPDRYRVIVMEGAFHGRTLATIAATGTDKVLEGFDPIVDAFDRVAFGNLNELRAAISGETAAILMEPIQGEGGIRTASLDYLKAAREIADEFGVLLMFDEVQCGMGRTGKLFAHEWAGITPDVMALAKGLGGGFPVGAVLATDEAAKAITPGSHGTTFGGNPMAMAAGNAVMDVLLEAGFLEGVQASGRILKSGLDELVSRHPKVYSEARGSGLMLGLKCVVPAAEMVDKLRSAGMIVVGGGENTIRLLPPLIIGKSEIDEAIGKLDQVANDWEGA